MKYSRNIAEGVILGILQKRSQSLQVSWRLHDFLFPHVQPAVSGISMSVSQFLWQKIQYVLQKNNMFKNYP